MPPTPFASRVDLARPNCPPALIRSRSYILPRRSLSAVADLHFDEIILIEYCRGLNCLVWVSCLAVIQQGPPLTSLPHGANAFTQQHKRRNYGGNEPHQNHGDCYRKRDFKNHLSLFSGRNTKYRRQRSTQRPVTDLHEKKLVSELVRVENAIIFHILS